MQCAVSWILDPENIFPALGFMARKRSTSFWCDEHDRMDMARRLWMIRMKMELDCTKLLGR